MSLPLDPMPARMINEWVYCPRLAVLESLHQEWAENAETEDGHRVHRRVDEERGAWPAAEDILGKEVARSVWMTAEDEAITAKLDLVEAVGDEGLVRPVDYKRGAIPDVPEQAYEPERVQVCAQALVLRSHGYRVEEGAIWFAKSRRRVAVPITEALVERTRSAARELRAALDAGVLPQPLVDSPRCNGCSLAPICLPDELEMLAHAPEDWSVTPLEDRLHRKLLPARDDLLPLHVITQGARVGINGQELVVSMKGEELGRAPLPQTSQVGLFGNIQVSTQALRVLLSEGKPVAFHSRGGWFYGYAGSVPHGNIFVRRAQYSAVDDPARRLAVVRRLVETKLRNQRTLLRRNSEEQDHALARLEVAAEAASEAPSVDVARGHEGDGAAAYFKAFPAMLKAEAAWARFDFHGRNRRPPADPVNAALSFVYALLVREWTQVLTCVGLDPFLGFLHEARHGRPALALDLMEEFRPIVADSVVIGVLNTGEVRQEHFVQRGPACNLNDAGRKHVLEAWERRMDTLVTHPVFGYRISYRRVFEVQARLLGRHLLGEIDTFPAFQVR